MIALRNVQGMGREGRGTGGGWEEGRGSGVKLCSMLIFFVVLCCFWFVLVDCAYHKDGLNDDHASECRWGWVGGVVQWGPCLTWGYQNKTTLHL